MARVTVEDCLKNVENRFQLVLKASARAHDIQLGAPVDQISIDDDKPGVLALREIALGIEHNTTSEEELASPSAEAAAAAERLFADAHTDSDFVEDKTETDTEAEATSAEAPEANMPEISTEQNISLDEDKPNEA